MRPGADRRYRVAIVTTSYPTAENPVQGTFVREHARAAALRCDVAVVHLERTREVRWLQVQPLDDPTITGVRVRYPSSPRVLSYVAHLAATIAGLRRLRRDGFDPDVVHAHFFLAGAPVMLAGRLMEKPVVVTEHWSAFLPEDPFELGPLALRAARWTFRRAAFVLPVSEALRAGMEGAGIRARFRVVANSYDESIFHGCDGETPKDGHHPRLLSVGLLYEAKQLELAFEALALARARRPDVSLDVVGDGPLRGEYERRVAELGLTDVVRFHGLRPKSEVGRFMRDADLFLLTSRFETSACVLIEAQASGLPAVATAVGAVPETLAKDAGILVRPSDAADLARGLEDALDELDRFDRQAIAESARARFGYAAVGEALASVYAQAVEEHRQ